MLGEFADQGIVHAEHGVRVQILVASDKDMGDKFAVAGCIDHEMHMGGAARDGAPGP
jgi:hypothetical protein